MKTMVCLSGTLCDKDLWQSQQHALSSAYQFVFPCIHTHDTVSDVVASMVKTLPKTFSVMGMSGGAVVAFEMIRQVPNRLDKVCIVAGNPHVSPTMADHLKEQVNMMSTVGVRAFFENQWLPKALSPFNRDDEKLQNRIIAMAEREGIDTYAKQVTMLNSRREGVTPLKAFSGDVLAVCGEDDPICTPDVHKDIADTAPNGRLIVLPKTGHYINFENEQGLNKALLDFF